jgi:phosphohistidine swiveling domain-containing protein
MRGDRACDATGRDGAVARVVVGGALAALTLVWPTPAWAIPSPEVILSSASALGWLGAGLLALLGIGIALPRGRRRSGVQRLAGPLSVVLLLLSLLAVDRFAVQREAARIEHEFRCDVGYHDQRRRATPDWEELQFDGVAGYMPAARFADSLAAPDVHTTALDLRLPLWFDAGHLADPSTGRVARQLHLAELADALREALQQAEAVGQPAVVLLASQRPNPLMYYDAEHRAEIVSLLRRFARVEVYLAQRHDPEDPFYADATWLTGDTSRLVAGQRVRVADPSAQVQWPVLDEGMLVDAGSVWRPAFGRTRSAAQMARQLDDPNVVVVVPFASFYRSSDTYLREFVRPLLRGIEQDRVIPLDYSSQTIRDELDQLPARIDGRPWVVVGVSKFDVLHYGLDAIHAVASSERGDALLKGFAGWTSDLGAVAAVRAVRVEAMRRALPGRSGAKLARRAFDANDGAVPPWRWFFWWGLAWGVVGLPFDAVAWREGLRFRKVTRRVDSFSAWNGRAARSVLGSVRSARRGARIAALAQGVLLVLSVWVAASATAVAGFLAPGSTGSEAWVGLAAGLCIGGRELGGALRAGGALRWIDVAGAVALAAGVGLVVAVLPGGTALALAGVLAARAVVVVLPARWAASGDRPSETVDKAGRLRAVEGQWGSLGFIRVPRGEVRTVEGGAEAFGAPVRRSTRWVVRSSTAVEDGPVASYAGRWPSFVGVADEGVEAAVRAVRATYPAGDPGRVLVQRQVEGRRWIVVFSEDPGAPGSVRVEWTERGPDQLTAGSAGDVRCYRLSRWTGRWTPSPSRRDAATLDRAAFLALWCAEMSGGSVDLELVEDEATRMPWVVQVRPATGGSGVADDREEWERLARATEAAGAGETVLVPLAWESGDRVSESTVEWIRHLRSPGGPWERGARAAGSATPSGGEPIVWRGAWFARPARGSFVDRVRAMGRGVPGGDERGLVRAATWVSEARRAAVACGAGGRWRDADDALVGVCAATAWTEHVANAPAPKGFAGDRVPAWLRAPSMGARYAEERGGIDGGWRQRWWYRAPVDLEATSVRWGDVPTELGAWDDPFDDVRAEAGDSPTWEQAVARVRDAAHDTLVLIFAGQTAAEGVEGAPMRRCGERTWTLEQLELEGSGAAERMVGARSGFAGRAVHIDPSKSLDEAIASHPAGEPWVVVSGTLDAALVYAIVAAGESARPVGWIAQRGTMLAHAAIVAREIGLPVVVVGEEIPASGRWVRVAVDGAMEIGDYSESDEGIGTPG